MIDPKKVLEDPHLHIKFLKEIIPFAELLQSAKFSDGTILAPFSGFRDSEEQNRLFKIGRELPGEKVTNAPGGRSRHNYGIACDFGLVRDKKFNSPLQPAVHDCWAWLKECVKEFPNLEWGAYFKVVDMPHVQLKTGLSVTQLSAAMDAGGWDGVVSLIR